jgi:hypothetical protein
LAPTTRTSEIGALFADSDSEDDGDERDHGEGGASSTAMDVAAEGGKRAAEDAFGDGGESEDEIEDAAPSAARAAAATGAEAEVGEAAEEEGGATAVDAGGHGGLIGFSDSEDEYEGNGEMDVAAEALGTMTGDGTHAEPTTLAVADGLVVDGDGEDSGDEGDDEMDDGMDGASSTAMDVAAEGGKRSAADAFGDGEESEMSTAVATATPAMGAMEVETGGETEAVDGTSTVAKKKKTKKRGGRGKPSRTYHAKQHRRPGRDR